MTEHIRRDLANLAALYGAFVAADTYVEASATATEAYSTGAYQHNGVPIPPDLTVASYAEMRSTAEGRKAGHRMLAILTAHTERSDHWRACFIDLARKVVSP